MNQKEVRRYLKSAPMVPVVMALGLDKEGFCERLLVGEETQVRRRLEGDPGTTVFYDKVQPLGTMLFWHEDQMEEKWLRGAVFPLREALVSRLRRKDREQTALGFFSEKQNYHDPVSVYTACQCWYHYTRNCSALGAAKNAEAFTDLTKTLISTFRQGLWGEEKSYSAGNILENAMQLACGADAQARIWYPGAQRDRAYLLIDGSFYPAIFYYLNHLRDWGLCFCRCSNCGRMFVASSRHHSLCGPECHKEKNRQNKRDFDQRARQNQYDVDYKNISQRMRNRLNSLRRRNVPEEELEAAEESFAEFRKDALKRKKTVKTKEEADAFRGWLLEQEQRFELFCEG